MAKARVELICKCCGNSFERIEYKTNRKEADAWAEWTKENIDTCPDCYKAAKIQKTAEESSAMGLPTIEGSEKQIAWASSIRIEKLDLVEKIITDATRRTNAEVDTDRKVKMTALLDEFAKAREKLAIEVSAKFWIDRRFSTGKALLSEMIKK